MWLCSALQSISERTNIRNNPILRRRRVVLAAFVSVSIAMPYTPDSELDLLFPPDLIPYEVSMALHSDLHVRYSVLFILSWRTG